MLLILNSNSLNYYTRIQKINQSINLEGNKKGQKVVPYRIGLDLKNLKRVINSFITGCFNITFQFKSIQYISHFLYRLEVQKIRND